MKNWSGNVKIFLKKSPYGDFEMYNFIQFLEAYIFSTKRDMEKSEIHVWNLGGNDFF